MNRLYRCLLGSAAALAFLGTTTLATAAGDTPYSGDLLTRSTITGDWGGVRNDLANKGVTIDLNLTQTYQGVVDGGKASSWQYGGRGDLVVKMDSGKMGLWPGGFLTAELEGNFGNNTINRNTGALMPADTNQIFPNSGGNNQLNLVALNYAQFLSPYFGVLAGKLDTLAGADMNEFAGSNPSGNKGDTQFMNTALNANPTLLTTVPYSTLGAGVIILPTKDPNAAVVTLAAIAANGKPYSSGFDRLDGDKLTFVGEGRLRTDFFGKTGHQLLGFSYSNMDRASIDQRIGDALFFDKIQKKSDSWAIFYNFDQYLYEPVKGSGRGIGIFGRFGASDGNPNPVHYMWSVGIGGKGALACRPNDQFGIGYYQLQLSNPTFTIARKDRSLLRDEQGFEAYYNIALTPAVQLTPDVQIIQGAQREILDPTSGNHLQDLTTAVVMGLRLKLLF